jgi:hypothetical protein
MKPGEKKEIQMNSLYHIAILEGFLSQHAELPRNVQDAIAHLKMASEIDMKLAAGNAAKKPRKKWRMTPEQKAKNVENLARMRAIAAKNRELFWTPERRSKVTELRAEGQLLQQIAKTMGVSHSALRNAVNRYGL